MRWNKTRQKVQKILWILYILLFLSSKVFIFCHFRLRNCIFFGSFFTFEIVLFFEYLWQKIKVEKRKMITKKCLKAKMTKYVTGLLPNFDNKWSCLEKKTSNQVSVLFLHEERLFYWYPFYITIGGTKKGHFPLNFVFFFFFNS